MGIWKVRTLTETQNGKLFALLKVVVLFSFWLDSSCVRNAQCVLSIENNILSRIANSASEKCAKVFVALCVLLASVRRPVFTHFHCFLSQPKFNINIIIEMHFFKNTHLEFAEGREDK